MGDAEPPQRIVERVGRWRLEHPLGSGSFGSTWSARDPSGRVAVVKLLTRPPGDEIRALAKIHHPAVVESLGAGTEPLPHLVMATAPGRPLSVFLGDLSPDGATAIVGILADALAACHAAGIPHGDIKPDNLMFDPHRSRLTVIDFGLVDSTGGTPRYAAPERPGSVPSAAADVYAIGLIAWELFAGRLPWPDDAFAERFDPDVPELTVGPVWLRRLVGEMLRPDPAARPSAAVIADACEANGITLGARDAEWVTRRARASWIHREEVDRAIARWLVRGRPLAIVGPVGSGRSHTLARVANELQARGTPFVTLSAGGGPYGPIEAALADPSLPGPAVGLPRAADPLTQADAVADALIARADPEEGDPSRLVVLVDDWDTLDAGTRSCIEALATPRTPEGTRNAPVPALLIAAVTAPAGIGSAALQPLGPSDTERLIEGILGPVDGALLRSAIRTAGVWPADLVAYIVATVERGALVWSRRSWVVAPDRLEALEASWVRGAPPSTGALSEAARRLGALVALAQPIDRHEAMAITGADDRVLGTLIDADLVRGGPHLRCGGPAATTALLRAPPDLPALARALLERRLQAEEVVWAGLGSILAATGDRDRVAALGGRCVTALSDRDVERAVVLAEDLWAVAPGPTLAAARTSALVRAGRIDEARRVGRDFLGAPPPGPEDVPILIAMATGEGMAGDPVARRRWIDLAVAATGDAPLGSELRLCRARAALDAGDHAEAIADCRALCEVPPDPDASPDRIRTWLRAMRLLAQARARQAGAAAGLAVLEDLPDDLGGRDPERAMIEGTRGRLLWHVGQPRAAAGAMEAAAAHRRGIPLIDRARLENNAGLCWYSVGDVVKAVACWERALLAFERIGAPLDAVYSRVNLCQGYRDLGRWPRAETMGTEAVAAAHRQGVAALEAMGLGNLGDVALWQRDFARAGALYDRAEAIAVGDAFAAERVELARRRAELATLRWDPDAEARVDLATRLAVDHDAKAELGRCLAIGAVVWARNGRIAETTEAIEGCLSGLREIGASGELAIARLWVCEAWLALGQRSSAAVEAEAVIRYADEFVRPPLRRWAQQILSRSRHTAVASSMERLTQVAVRIARHHELDEIFDDLAKAAVELIDAERALVVLMARGRQTIAARAGRPLGQSPSTSIVERVLSTGREVVVTDLEERGDLRDNQSVISMRLRAAMCVPLVVDGTPLGALYLDSRGSPGGDLREALALVRALAAHASVALHNARLTQEIRRALEQADRRAADAQRAHRFADALLRAVPTPVLITGDDQTVIDANDAAVRLLHADPTQSDPLRIDTLLEALEGGLEGEHLLWVNGRRSSVPVHLTQAEVVAPDGARRCLYALTDLTPRIAAEAQQVQAVEAAREASAAKSRFLATMSHELRTPLNAIIGYSELLLEETSDAEVASDLGRILSAGQHLLGLIDDVLDISRIEAGRLELWIEEQRLEKVFSEVIALTRPVVLDSGARFDIDIPPDLGSARTDHRRVRQVCTNLLTNAIRHAGGTSVALVVVAGEHQISVEVIDDGIGIPPDQLSRLFQPFVRLAPTRASGAGLGLAIAQRLAQQLGGGLQVRSDFGSGTTFRFVFPRHLRDPEESITAEIGTGS